MGADLYIEKMEREEQHTGFSTDINVGYFRDSYNDSNLFQQLDLSYWTLDKEYPGWFTNDGLLNIDGACGLIALLEERRHKLEGTFVEWTDEGKNFKYFPEKLDALIAFLKKAIELDSLVIWSV